VILIARVPIAGVGRLRSADAMTQDALATHKEKQMDTTTLLVIVIAVLLLGGGGFFYRRRA
jgi:LPXTG-motif cell wall-anchored protein